MSTEEQVGISTTAEDDTAGSTETVVDEAASTEAAESDGTEAGPGPSRVHIRNISIKCGHCDTYQTLAQFKNRGEWNAYGYECENDICDPEVTRTWIEVPVALDEFANRDPSWHGGAVHAGADHRGS